ncbi:MAG: hypothetical protein M3R38_17730 [Actinomycetota bacterium]|nr:hypothetical protein [Actinomycetota bacterium]
MGQCSGIKGDGTRCRGIAGAASGLCAAHDPARRDARRRAASRAGRSRPNGELRRVKDRLLGLADDVLAGEVNRADAAVVAQLLNVLLRATEVERRTADLADLTERLGELEERAERLRGT